MKRHARFLRHIALTRKKRTPEPRTQQPVTSLPLDVAPLPSPGNVIVNDRERKP